MRGLCFLAQLRNFADLETYVISWVDMNPVAQELNRNVFIGFYLPQGLTICNFGVTFCIVVTHHQFSSTSFFNGAVIEKSGTSRKEACFFLKQHPETNDSNSNNINT